MTEEEAKTKWCPYARLGSSTSGLGGFNRFISPAREADFDGTRCVGSACMAFRWDFKTAARKSDFPGSASTSDGGFCGLASRP